jgi:hypothetical protein
MTLRDIRVFAFLLAGLVIVLGLTRCGDDRHPLAVSAAAQACRIHTLPSPCDGKCVRQDSRSYT